jgi:hypothetical protein
MYRFTEGSKGTGAPPFTLVLTRRCAAPADAVYRVLADPLSHWSGAASGSGGCSG